VIAKANSSHPGVTKLLAECAVSAADANELPKGSVQLLYRTSHQDGERLAADPRTGAIAYTGSRGAGLRLKSAADAAGTPIYLELSSVNPVLLLPAIVAEKFEELVQEFAGSCLLAAGQFCTCPNMVLLLAGVDTERFITRLADEFASRPSGTLLSGGVLSTLQHVLADLRAAGAQLAAGGGPSDGPGYSFQNTLLRVSGGAFLENPESLQSEAFGNVTTVVVAEDVEQLGRILRRLEGSLTGSVYSLPDHDGDEQIYRRVEPLLRQRVGRLLNDKMPTGVAVSPGMNHGGPFPATGHPGFTAVGIPAALDRFAMLQCYDNVRSDRLPACLQDANPNGRMWRQIDGTWTQAHVG
ncbi:MAG: aldehyde dehydrogenase family protein, partial [Planctomycetota bacterium]